MDAMVAKDRVKKISLGVLLCSMLVLLYYAMQLGPGGSSEKVGVGKEGYLKGVVAAAPEDDDREVAECDCPLEDAKDGDVEKQEEAAESEEIEGGRAVVSLGRIVAEATDGDVEHMSGKGLPEEAYTMGCRRCNFTPYESISDGNKEIPLKWVRYKNSSVQTLVEALTGKIYDKIRQIMYDRRHDGDVHYGVRAYLDRRVYGAETCTASPEDAKINKEEAIMEELETVLKEYYGWSNAKCKDLLSKSDDHYKIMLLINRSPHSFLFPWEKISWKTAIFTINMYRIARRFTDAQGCKFNSEVCEWFDPLVRLFFALSTSTIPLSGKTAQPYLTFLSCMYSFDLVAVMLRPGPEYAGCIDAADNRMLPYLLLNHPGDSQQMDLGMPYVDYLKEIIYYVVEPVIKLHLNVKGSAPIARKCRRLLDEFMGIHAPDKSRMEKILDRLRHEKKREAHRRCREAMLLDELGWGYLIDLY